MVAVYTEQYYNSKYKSIFFNKGNLVLLSLTNLL